MRNLIFVVGLSVLSSLAQAATCNDGQAAFVAGNYSKALSILQSLAQQGDSCAQNRLADMYKFGMGVPMDKVKALALYEAAAAQGNSEAMLQAELLRSAKQR